ncbi:MAG: DUF4011 domain-containing protein [Parvularculaceae bacterium]
MTADATQTEQQLALEAWVRTRIEALRPKLLDLTRKNPLISTKLTPRSNSYIRVVDELPDVLSFELSNQQSMRLVPLPPLDTDPKDELRPDFRVALSEARHTDEVYLEAIKDVDSKSIDAQDEIRRLERELKDRLRIKLGLPARQTGADISLVQHAKLHGISPSYDLPSPDEENQDGRHRDDAIQTLLLADDLERKMTGISTKCRTWMQETGINVLHAAFGFLEWQDDLSRSSAIAPLVLMPAEFTKKKTMSGPEFWVKGLGESGEANLVLAEMLRTQYAIELPAFSQGSIEDYLAEVDALKPPNLKWKVRRQVAFGVFPSARMAMYHDLDTSKTAFHNKEVVKRLLGGSESSVDSPFADEYDVDSPEIEKKIPCLVMDADSSQLSVIADINDGRSLAVEGPPGTGKSQTIVNTIAAALAAGKKVLFVAEKLAALDVVKSRLEAVGLGEFVLPLQAERSTREQVISSVRDRIEMGCPRANADYDSRIAQFKAIRSELSAYIDIISSPYGETGLKVYDVLGKAMWSNDALKEKPDIFNRPPIADASTFDKNRIETLREAGDQLDAASSEAHDAQEYWRGLDIDSADRFTLDHIQVHATAAKDAYATAAAERDQLGNFELDPYLSQQAIADIVSALLDVQEKISDCDPSFVVLLAKSDAIGTVEKFRETCERYQAVHSKLAKFLVDSSEPALPSQLRRIHEICAQNRIEKLDLRAVVDRINAEDRERKTLDSIRASLAELSSDVPEIEKLELDSVRTAYSLVLDAARETLALRSSANADPAAQLLIQQTARAGEQLRSEKETIEQSFTIPADLKSLELAAHATALKDGGFFSIFSPSYRAAKRTARLLSKSGKLKRDEAARQLQALSDWKASETKFLADEQSKACFGLHFRGIDTDFASFERLSRFYEEIDRRLSGNTNRSLRRFLKEGDLDALLSIPDLPPASWNGNISDLEAQISPLTSSIGQLKSAHSELTALVRCFVVSEKMRIDALPELASQVEANQKRKTNIESYTAVSKLLSDQYRGVETDVETLGRHLAIAHIALAQPTLCDAILSQIESGCISPCIATLESVQKHDEEALCELKKLCELTYIPEQHFIVEPRSQRDIAAYLEDAVADQAGLQANAKYARARRRVNELGFEWATKALMGQEQTLQGFGKILEASVIRAMALEVIREHGALLDKYPGSQLDALRKQLADLDRKIILLARKQLRAIVAGTAKPPSGNGAGPKSTWTERALLENEIAKQKRFVSVRDLTNRAGRALQELKPCWMMSPLAVAQYLHAGRMPFDLCIIDEASQMKPEDAIGALARCGQAMVVGDTNQLPPSNFFQKMLNDGDDDDDDALVDEESILEIANSKLRPARRLRWHYRSEHSGLIRFSNELVYNRNLVVFPSASEQRKDMGVSLVSVDGSYRTGVNPTEAKAIVEASLRLMRTHPDRSLGIVTLNQKQRDLLIDEMNYALEQDRQAAEYVEEWRTRNDGLESFFIKNLENVQGDERDAIFIGTVYGPEQPGTRVMQRFGPINGKAGRRRLNVLFSRAKKQIVTFSSMKPSDILADEHSNPGTYMLKRWLEYSASGVLEATDQPFGSTDSDFEDYVIDQLKAMGCEPVPQVGSAGYFIDIGVKHPKWPYGYILAVECDGASYHSCRSARDRDRLRQQVLQRLGWKFHRIWSTDWFNDPLREAARLRRAVEARLSELEAQHEKYADPATISQSQEDRIDVSDKTDTADDDGRKNSDAAMRQADLLDDVLEFSKPEQPQAPTSYIEVGDQVRVRYLTGEDATVLITISDKLNDPNNGIVSAHEPLATAILGAEEGEEVEVLIGRYVRKALIEKVVKQNAA